MDLGDFVVVVLVDHGVTFLHGDLWMGPYRTGPDGQALVSQGVVFTLARFCTCSGIAIVGRALQGRTSCAFPLTLTRSACGGHVAGFLICVPFALLLNQVLLLDIP